MSDPVYVGYHTLDNTLSMPNDARFLMYDPAKSGSYNITGALLKSQILASPVVTGQMTVPAGLASAPSMSTAGDTNTGIYFPAADQVGVTCGGVQRGLFSSTGLGVTGTITGTSFNSITALASVAPLIDGTATIGTSTAVARQDHVHPTDTSRAPAAGSTSVITLGTVTTGTWSGTTIATSKGGTGTTAAPVAGGVTYGVSTSALGTTAAGTSGYILRSNGAAAPSWTPNDLTSFPDSTFKKSVRVATTANITLSAVQTIDGIVLVAGDRVLVKNQTTTAQNGIYVVNASTWTRSTEADSSAEIASALVAVDSGTTNGGRLFTNIFKTTDVIGTTAMPWYEVASTSSFTTTATDIKVNGTQSVGTLNTFPRADHVHPVNTADQITQTASNVFLTPAQKTVATQAATSSVNGYLSSTDWTTFNNKQPAGSYATSGANSNITSLSGLTTPLSMSQGGLGTGTIVNNTVLTVGDNGSLSLRSPGPSGKKVLTGDLAGTPIFADIKTMAVDLSSDQTIGGTKTFSSLTNSGNLNFTGTGNRITGDFDNSVLSNRTMFKTSTTNGNTSVRSIPDGTSTTSSFGSYNNSNADNSGIILMVSSPTNAFIHSTRTGTAAIQPLSLRINAVDHHMLTTSGNTILKTGVLISDDDGANKLQVGGSIKAEQYKLSALNTAPASATATGTTGEIRVTSTHIYVCTATNTWVRASLSTW